MRRVGDHRLLTALEETQLARRVRAGGSEGAAAKEKLILHNMRLVFSEARKHVGRGVEYEDLVQSGVIGLNRAAEKFDERKGFAFSTYAMWWIRQSCQRVLQKADTIHLPDQVKKARLTAGNNPDMTDAEIAEKMELPVSRVRAARRAAQVTASLDAPHRTPEGEAGSDYDLIPDIDADDPADVQESGAWVRDLVDELPKDERRVIEMLFGLNGYGGHEHTVKEIAATLGLQDARVRELQQRALKMLRTSTT